GLLGAPAWAVRNIGVVHGYGCITDHNVRRPARTHGSCSPDVRNAATTLGSHGPGRSPADNSDDRRKAIHTPCDLVGDVRVRRRMNISSISLVGRGLIFVRQQKRKARRLNRNAHQLLVMPTTRQAQHRSHRHQRAQYNSASYPSLLEASLRPARSSDQWSSVKSKETWNKSKELEI